MEPSSLQPTASIATSDHLDAAWQTWQPGMPVPRWERFLPEPGDPDQLLALIQIDIEHRVKAGLAALLEERYFEHAAVQLNAEQEAELLRWEYQLRWKNGERPKRSDYLAAFAQHARTLADLRPRWNCPRCRRAASLDDETADVARCTECDSTFPLSEIFARRSRPKVPAIPDYEILAQLGQGGMGLVYKAWQRSLKRLVALKVIRAPIADEATRRRFQTEAEAAAGLQHPNIVQIHEVGTSDGQPYLVQEWVAGGSLDRFLRGTPQVPALTAMTVERLARAMAFAHRSSILHRDLKPANILLAPLLEAEESRSTHQALPWIPKIADFGLAKRLEDDASQTQSGAIIGTPSYMAPEQARGKAGATGIGPAADIYALGAILYEMLTGRAPFRAATAWDTIQQVLADEPVPLRRLQPTITPDLETICLKCLEKDPSRRYPNADELADDLRRTLTGEPIQARPVALWERGLKWARRRPALAGVLGLSVLLLLASVVVIVGAFYNRELRESRDQAQQQETEARTQRGLADEQRRVAEREKTRADELRALAQQQEAVARRFEYVAHMRVAQQMADEGDIPQMLELLDRHEPSRQPPTSDGANPDFRGFEWHYLKGHHRLTLKGFGHEILDLAFRADGTHLASACWDGNVRIHDARTGKIVNTLKAGTTMVCCVAFSADGTKLAAGVGAGVQIWDAGSGKELLPATRGLGMVYGVAFSADGTRVATVGQADTLQIRDAVTGKELRAIKTASSNWRRVAFSADGKTLVAVGERGVAAWDSTTGAPRPPTTGRHIGEGGLSLGEEDGRLKVWNVATTTLVHTLEGNVEPFNRVAFSPAAHRVAAGGEALKVHVWDLASGKHLLTLRGHKPRILRVALAPLQVGINALALGADGRLLASAANDRTVLVWDTTPRPPTLTFPGFDGRVAGMHFSADGRRLAVASKASGVTVFDVATAKAVRELRGQKGDVAVALSPDGQHLASANADSVRLWNVDAGQEVRSLPGGATSIAFSHDGKRLAIAGKGIVRICDPRGNELARFAKYTTAKLANAPGLHVAFRPDGKRITVASDDPDNRGIYLVDADMGKEVLELSGHSWGVHDIAFSADSNLIATAGGDNVVGLFDAMTGRPVHMLRGHTGYPAGVRCVAFSPVGGLLVSGGDDRCVRVWDILTGQEMLTLKGHAAPLRCVSFSRDGQRIFSLDLDGTMRIWDGRPLPKAAGN